MGIDAFGLLSGNVRINVPGKFSFSVASLNVTVPDVLSVTAQGIRVAYDPAANASQELLRVYQAQISFPKFGITGTLLPYDTTAGNSIDLTDSRLANNPTAQQSATMLGKTVSRGPPNIIPGLVVRENGFTIGQGILTFSGGANGISLGSFLHFDDLRVGVTNFSVNFTGDNPIVFNGSIFFASGGASLSVGGGVKVTITDRKTAEPVDLPGAPDTEALRATLTFHNGKVDAFLFRIDTISVQLGSILTFQGTDIFLNTGATGSQELLHIGSIGASVKIGSLTLSGEGRNFAILGDGSFKTLPGFGVAIGVGSATGDTFKWPSWLPIHITEIGITWPDIAADPSNFSLTLSASVTGLQKLKNLQFSGAIEGVVIDVHKLLNGEFPITDIGSIGVQVSGDFFGGEISAGLIGGILKISSSGTLIDALDTTTPVQKRVFFLGLEGGFTMVGKGGFSIRLGLSELGPLDVLITVDAGDGILLEPESGLTINHFVAGVEFFKSLPTIDDPMDLRGSAFSIGALPTAGEWLADVKQQVLNQYRTLQANPNLNGFTAAFVAPMTITGSATLYSRHVSTKTLNGVVIIKISTDGKILIGGQLNFADNQISMSAKLYLDLSQVAKGGVTILFLADIPDQTRILSVYGRLKMGFRNASGQDILFQPDTGTHTASTVGTARPTALVADPSGGSIDVSTINSRTQLSATETRPYIDLVFQAPAGQKLDYASILDGEETIQVQVGSHTYHTSLTPVPLQSTVDPSTGLMGYSAVTAADTASLVQAVSDANIARFRYYITGDVSTGAPLAAFPIGEVNVLLLPGTFQNAAVTVNGTSTAGLSNDDAILTFVVQGATAQIVNPGPDGSIDAGTINNRRYLDIAYSPSVGQTLTTNFAQAVPFEILGADGAPTGITVVGTPTLVDGTTSTYRYTLSGDLPIGDIGVHFFGGRFADGQYSNVETTQTFTVTGATADLVNPGNARTVGLDALNAAGYLEVTFRPTAGATIDAASINGDELILKDSAGKTVPLAGAPERVLVDGQGTNTWRFRLSAPLAEGSYTVSFAADSFRDSNGLGNLAATETFQVASSHASLTDPGVGGEADRETLNGRRYIDVTFTPAGKETLDAASITDDAQEFTLTGASGENLQVNGAGVLVDGTTNTYRYSFTGQLNTGDLAVHFLAGSWQDVAATDGGVPTLGVASTQTVHIITQASEFYIQLSGGIELHASEFLDEPLIKAVAQVTLEIDPARKVLTLSFSGQLSVYKLGTVGASAGRFILDLSGTTGPAPQLWGVATIQSNFGFLEPLGVHLAAEGTLQINTSSAQKTETLILPGIGSQTYQLAANSFSLELGGKLTVSVPTTNIQLFNAQGSFYLKIDPERFEIYLNAAVSFGIGPAQVNYGSVTGLLEIVFQATRPGEIPGVAGLLKVSRDAGIGIPNVGTFFQASGSVALMFNTTFADQVFDVPKSLLQFLSPGDPTSLNIFASAPGLDGGIDASAKPAPYFVATIQAHLIIQSVIALDGFLQLKVNGNQLTITGAVGGSIPVLGAISGTINFSLTADPVDPANTGIVGRAYLTLVASGIPGVNLNGELLLEFNSFSTAQTIQTFAIDSASGAFKHDSNNRLVVESVPIEAGPFLHLRLRGSLEIAKTITLAGKFEFTLNTQYLDIAADAQATIGPLGQVAVAGQLHISSAGLVAHINVSLGLDFGKDVGLRFTANATLDINTSDSPQTLSTFPTPIQPGFQITISGAVDFLGFATGQGSALIYLGGDGFKMKLDLEFFLGGLNFQAHGLAKINSAGLVLGVDVSVAADEAVFSISASGQLKINTTGVSSEGIDPGFYLSLNGSVSVLKILNFSASFKIVVNDDGWRFDFAASASLFGFANLNANGWLDSNGNFAIHLHGGLTIGNSAIGISGSVDFDISSQVSFDNSGNAIYDFHLHLGGSVEAHLLILSLGVSLDASFDVHGNGSVPIQLTLTARLKILFITISFTHTFTLGYLQLPGPVYLAGDLNSAQNWSGGTLILNSGNRSIFRNIAVNGPDTYVIQHIGGTAGDETIKVSLGGRSNTYKHVSRIEATGGSQIGDYQVTSGVLSPVSIQGGSGDTTVLYAGQGDAVLNGGSGNDVFDNNSNAVIVINGGGGNDFITQHGTAPITIDGGDGDDVIYGGVAADTLRGGNGADVIVGGGGADRISGGAGDDVIKLDESGWGSVVDLGDNQDNDTLQFTGTGNADRFVVTSLKNQVMAIGLQSGEFITATAAENVILDTGFGADSVEIGSLVDSGVKSFTLNLGNPTDATDALGDDAADTVLIHGDDNVDDNFVLSESTPSNGEMTALAINRVGVNTFTILGAKRANGDNLTIDSGSGNDRLDAFAVGTDHNHDLLALRLAGNAGNDTLIGSSYDDTLDGGTGNDRLTGGPGHDTFIDAAGDDTLVESQDADFGLFGNYLVVGKILGDGKVTVTGRTHYTDNLTQLVSVTPGTGSFQLSLNGVNTTTINPTTATAQTVADALNAIPGVQTQVTGFGTLSAPWQVTFLHAPSGSGVTGVAQLGSSNNGVLVSVKSSVLQTSVQELWTNATGGTFRLTFAGYTTGDLAWNSSAAQIQQALRGLVTGVSGADPALAAFLAGVTVSDLSANGVHAWTVTLPYNGAWFNTPLLTATDSAMLGGGPLWKSDALSEQAEGARLLAANDPAYLATGAPYAYGLRDTGDRWSSDSIIESLLNPDGTLMFEHAELTGGASNNVMVLNDLDGSLRVGGTSYTVTPFTGTVALDNAGETGAGANLHEYYILNFNGQNADRVTINDHSHPAGYSELIVNGTNVPDRFTLDASGTGVLRTGTVTAGNTALAGRDVVTYSGVARVRVNGLAGDDTVVSDDTVVNTIIDLGTGDDLVMIGTVPLVPDAGNRTVEFPNGVPTVDTARLTNGNSAPLTVLGGDQSDGLRSITTAPQFIWMAAPATTSSSLIPISPCAMAAV